MIMKKILILKNLKLKFFKEIKQKYIKLSLNIFIIIIKFILFQIFIIYHQSMSTDPSLLLMETNLF